MKKTSLLPLMILFSFFACKTNKSDDQFSYNLLPVKTDEKWGYVDQKGKYIINPQFKTAYLFSDGLALVEAMDGKCGYISEDGKFVVNPTYKYAACFSEGLACVTPENGFPTFINTKGEVKFILKEANNAGSFKEGLACVGIKDKYGYIDNNGRIAINPQFESVSDFSNGLALIVQKKDSAKRIYGYIDKTGKIVINPQFDEANSFSEGLASVTNDGKKWGYIDEKGTYVINPQFDEAHDFKDGLAGIKQGESFGFIDKDGKIVINPQFEGISDFNNGLAAVCSSKDNWGYIDKDGKYSINPQFKSASRFYGSVAPVLSGDKIGFINKEGKYEANPQFTETFAAVYTFWKKGTFYLRYVSGVASDYFDMSEITNYFLKDAEDAIFKNINASSNLQDIVNLTKSAEALHALSQYSVINNKKSTINDDAAIESVTYFFKRPIWRNVPSYYYGIEIGSEKKYDMSTTIESITYNIKLDNWGKGDDKGELLAKELQSVLSKKFRGTDTEPQFKPISNSMSFEEEAAWQKAYHDSVDAADAEGMAAYKISHSTSGDDSDVKSLKVFSSHYKFSILYSKTFVSLNVAFQSGI